MQTNKKTIDLENVNINPYENFEFSFKKIAFWGFLLGLGVYALGGNKKNAKS